MKKHERIHSDISQQSANHKKAPTFVKAESKHQTQKSVDSMNDSVIEEDRELIMNHSLDSENNFQDEQQEKEKENLPEKIDIYRFTSVHI